MKATTTTQKQRDVEVTGAAAQTFTGLCATCNDAADCVYRKRRGVDALFCELFNGQAVSGNESSAGDAATEVVVAPEQPQVFDIRELKGLCVNCAYRDVCKLPRPRGGVWHCEEYA
jgi:hypothetical protein